MNVKNLKIHFDEDGNLPEKLRARSMRSRIGSSNHVVKAVDGVDLQLSKGEIFVLLGHNGAGKSSMISALCGLIKPSSGEIFVLGD